MSQGRLSLRAWPVILLAYFVAPVVAATGLWLVPEIGHLVNPHAPTPGFWMWTLDVMLVEISGLILEVFIVTPLILIFMFTGGRHTSTLIILSIGFLCGIGLYLYPTLVVPALSGLPIVMSLTDFLQSGMIGVLTAGAFRLIAFVPTKQVGEAKGSLATH